MTTTLHMGDCLEVMPTLPAGSVDAIITDPPYPEIDREYGRMSEADWHIMMHAVVAESRRLLKPTGSAVFILQPNSRKVGSMRPWLFEFQAWACREWNMVQDAYWWNTAAMPNGVATHGALLRSSLKMCVWLGPSDCYRDQIAVLDREEKPWMRRSENRIDVRSEHPSGNGINRAGCLESVRRRGGSIPFNVIAMGNGHKSQMAGCHGHGAGTPRALADWWTRYITVLDGVVLDPFMGSGTMGLAALRRQRSFVGIEAFPRYFAIAERRLARATAQLRLPFVDQPA